MSLLWLRSVSGPGSSTCYKRGQKNFVLIFKRSIMYTHSVELKWYKKYIRGKSQAPPTPHLHLPTPHKGHLLSVPSFSFLAKLQHMEFLGQGSDLSCSCSDAGSLTHCARPGIQLISQQFQDTASPLAPQQELLSSVFFLFFVFCFFASPCTGLMWDLSSQIRRLNPSHGSKSTES